MSIDITKQSNHVMIIFSESTDSCYLSKMHDSNILQIVQYYVADTKRFTAKRTVTVL